MFGIDINTAVEVLTVSVLIGTLVFRLGVLNTNIKRLTSIVDELCKKTDRHLERISRIEGLVNGMRAQD